MTVIGLMRHQTLSSSSVSVSLGGCVQATPIIFPVQVTGCLGLVAVVAGDKFHRNSRPRRSDAKRNVKRTSKWEGETLRAGTLVVCRLQPVDCVRNSMCWD